VFWENGRGNQIVATRSALTKDIAKERERERGT